MEPGRRLGQASATGRCHRFVIDSKHMGAHSPRKISPNEILVHLIASGAGGSGGSLDPGSSPRLTRESPRAPQQLKFVNKGDMVVY
jgi:hypothetical protein